MFFRELELDCHCPIDTTCLALSLAAFVNLVLFFLQTRRHQMLPNLQDCDRIAAKCPGVAFQSLTVCGFPVNYCNDVTALQRDIMPVRTALFSVFPVLVLPYPLLLRATSVERLWASCSLSSSRSTLKHWIWSWRRCPSGMDPPSQKR